jgi:hypothetical protein
VAFDMLASLGNIGTDSNSMAAPLQSGGSERQEITVAVNN